MTDIVGRKTGEWIHYELNYPNGIIPFDYILASGEDFHEHSSIYSKYRPLKESEYNGILVLLNEEIDTIRGEVYYDLEYNKIQNKIPPNLYSLENRGYYTKGLKNGLWEYYYCSGLLKKKIEYKNGLPVSNYKIYREDGSVMIGLFQKSDSIWEVSKYKKDGKFIETITDRIEKFKELY